MSTENQITIKIEIEQTATETTDVLFEQTSNEQVTIDTSLENIHIAQNIVNTKLTEMIKQTK